MWSSSTCGCGCNKACKIDEYLDIKNYSREKRLIGKLALKCEDVILNATKTSLDDKKSITRKYIFVIISCYFYWFLLLLHKRLDKKRTRSITLIQNE